MRFIVNLDFRRKVLKLLQEKSKCTTMYSSRNLKYFLSKTPMQPIWNELIKKEVFELYERIDLTGTNSKLQNDKIL